MTCVLSMPAFYTNQFCESGTDKQNNGYESFDFNWINSQFPPYGLSDNQKHNTPCRTKASTGSSRLCRTQISNELSETFEEEQFNVHADEGYENDIKATYPDEIGSSQGKQDVTNLFNVCNKTDVELHHRNINDHGVKRKANITEYEDVYIPPKRVSPFLNTPKQRKDERKKILRISMKKLKQIDDPETFLRRTVLVNNLTKRLQTELRKDKFSTKNSSSVTIKRNCFSGYGLPDNNCMSDTYLINDPFLSGVHEEITDDMTDTLIKNVFHDKTNDKTKDFAIEEKSNITYDKIDIADEQSCIDSRIYFSSDNSQDTSNHISSNRRTTSTKNGSLWNCLGDSAKTERMSFDICDKLEVANMCNVNTCDYLPS